jgi:hypothetical protein
MFDFRERDALVNRTFFLFSLLIQIATDFRQARFCPVRVFGFNCGGSIYAGRTRIAHNEQLRGTDSLSLGL